MLIISNDRFSRFDHWARPVLGPQYASMERVELPAPKTKSATATGCDEEGRVRCAVVIDSIRSLGLGSALVDYCSLLALNLPCGGSTGVVWVAEGGEKYKMNRGF